MRANNSNKEVIVKGSKIKCNTTKRKNENNPSSTRGRSVTPVKNSNIQNKGTNSKSNGSQHAITHNGNNNNHHHHNLHPTKCLRGVSTRATYKRSPSPRKDWPFDEALLYPPHPREKSRTSIIGISDTSKQKVKTNSERVNRNTSLSPSLHLRSSSSRPCSASSVRHHSPHPTRCLRGVSIRPAYRRSPSPKRDWPFDEASLYPPHPKECSSKCIGHKRSAALVDTTKKKRKIAFGDENIVGKKVKGNNSSSNTLKSRINMNIVKVNKNKKGLSGTKNKSSSPKVVNKRQVKTAKSPISCIKKQIKNKSALESKIGLPIIDKRFDSNYDFDTESIATVLDGEESFELSPMTGLHVGWGGSPLKSSWKKKFSGDLETRISSALLWNENHYGSVVWRPHKCINEYRLVSNSKAHYNPYDNSSITQIGEYIWQTHFNGESKLISEYPPLFELLFVKKDSLLGSIFNKFCLNPSSHDVIFRELLTQSQFKFHKNILRINEVFHCETFPYTTFVMEYLPHSCMNWDSNTETYLAPSISKGNKGKLNRIYTVNGAKVIFSQVLDAYKYLHNKNISGIYLRPESVKMSHSLDETYLDKNGNTLTRLILSKGRNIFNRKRLCSNKVNINSELSKYWENSEQINIAGNNDDNSIRKIHDMIQNKKKFFTIPSKETYLFKLDNVYDEVNVKTLHTNSLYNSLICNHEKTSDDLHVKLNYIFKGRSTNSRELLFSGNRWLNPPEFYQGFFYRESEHQVNFEKSDIWNLGVFLHCLLSGRVPSIIDNEVVIDENVPFEIRDLISSMLKLNPDKRITLNGIFNSKWLLSETALQN
ncbi:hypothetical protein FG386_000584 [Cryptosporidium ryanae]|uniref:uncharacterized protein n=1 Tax=Cryptosporidium bovis TaxID=310047 RepID=UPI00351A4760|nr:hypothetical protein FG379_002578 [Cryptosporidium bovis]KAH8738560.1 hypothetical protein FG386_000584 [Cryptosporidium ryanae]